MIRTAMWSLFIGLVAVFAFRLVITEPPARLPAYVVHGAIAGSLP